VPGVTGVTNGPDTVLFKRFGLHHGRLAALGFGQRTVGVRVPGQLHQTHDLRRGQLDLAVPIPDQCLARGDPQGFGGLKIVVFGGLAFGHAGHEKRVSKRLWVTEACRGVIQRVQGTSASVRRRSDRL